MLILTRKVNERVIIGDEIEVSIVEIRGDQVKLGIAAPRTVKVFRHEVYVAIQEENRLAADSTPSAPLPSIPRLVPQKNTEPDS